MSMPPPVALALTRIGFRTAFWRQALSSGGAGLSVHLCPLVSLDAFGRMSRSQGDGEVGVCKEDPRSAKLGEGSGFLPTL